MQDDSSSAGFSVVYDGEALAAHSMDVKDLAPALLALAEAFEIGNSLLNGDNSNIRLNIKATQPGSFEVTVEIVQAFVMSTQFLSGAFVTSAVHLKDIFFDSGGVIGAIKFLKGRTPNQTPASEDVIDLETELGRFRVKKDAMPILESLEARKSLEVLVRPLNNPGIDRLYFQEGDRQLASIEKDDIEAFDILAGPANVTETIIPNQWLTVVAPNIYDSRGKWRLNDDIETNWYGMLDETYISDIFQRRRPIASGDLLIADVKLTHRVEENGSITLSRDVMRVHRHVDAGVQIDLFSRGQERDAQE